MRAGGIDEDRIIKGMVGRSLESRFPDHPSLRPETRDRVKAVMTKFSENRPPAANEKKPAAKLPGIRAYPDFWWTFLGRFTLLLGSFVFSTAALSCARVDDLTNPLHAITACITVFLK